MHDPDAFRMAAREILLELVGEGRARAAMVLDKGGRVVVEVGDCEGIDATAIGTFTVEKFDDSNFAEETRWGFEHNYHLRNIEGKVMLAVVFESKSSAGVVRVLVRRVARRLADLLGQIPGGGAGFGGGGQGGGDEARVARNVDLSKSDTG